MTDAVLLVGDFYHCAEDAFAGVEPGLEAAGLKVAYTTQFAKLDQSLLASKKLLVILRDGGSFMPLHNAGWAYQYGQGRVVYQANGHTLEILQHPMVQRLLTNASHCLL